MTGRDCETQRRSPSWGRPCCRRCRGSWRWNRRRSRRRVTSPCSASSSRRSTHWGRARSLTNFYSANSPFEPIDRRYVLVENKANDSNFIAERSTHCTWRPWRNSARRSVSYSSFPRSTENSFPLSRWSRRRGRSSSQTQRIQQKTLLLTITKIYLILIVAALIHRPLLWYSSRGLRINYVSNKELRLRTERARHPECETMGHAEGRKRGRTQKEEEMKF